MNTVKSFVKQFVAAVKGDDTAVLAEKAYRQATYGIKAQIATLEGETPTFEDAVNEAEDAQAMARINNGQPITNKPAFVQNLLNAKNKVTIAEEAHETHLKKIEFLKGELVALDTEVEA